MTVSGWIEIALFLLVLTALTPVIGGYMARVFTDEVGFLGFAERPVYRVLGVRRESGQDWKAYGRSVLVFSALGFGLLYLVLRTQSLHPFNPQDLSSPTWDLSFNTAASFLSNTNWQFYAGETTLSNFSQMFGLAVQNFISAAVGIAVLAAFIRGLASRSTKELGNFYVDVTRVLLYILLPLSVLGGLFLASQGALQTLGAPEHLHTLTGLEQTLVRGPVASQEAIKLLGTNGGGFFNVNSAMPFENASAFTNFVELLAIILIPAALTYTFGRMVGRQRQGWAIFAAMLALFLVLIVVVVPAEQHGTVAQHMAGLHNGGNLEGKEVRNGIAQSGLWTATTTSTSNGSVNSALDSYTGLGGAVPMAALGTSEVIFGGVGTGLYSMLVFVLLAVFIGGLMVGRTPEYLGKKLEAREIKLVSLAALFTPLTVLITTGLAIATKFGKPSIFASGPQGFSETLYAYLSQANNNGSAFAGYTGFVQPNAPGNGGSFGISFADILGGGTMVVARFVPILLVLAIAGALAGKKVAPVGPGTMRTDNPTFVVLLVGVVVLVGALTFFPALLLGPIVQSLSTQLF